MINASTTEGGPAVIVHQGKRAREVTAKFAHRLIPSRWLEKWKDVGDDFQLAVPDDLMREAGIPETMEQ
eukprot:11117720-Karenia_brevis.AAC.1